jgi:hypothetical protein
MAKKFKSLLNLLTLTEDPLIGSSGDVYFNVTSKNIKIYNGSIWVDLTPASDDPAPFYMHTHSYDGDVHTIDLKETIDFSNINENANVEENIPVIIGLDGGGPNDEVLNPNLKRMSLINGGEPDSTYYPESEYQLILGGDSISGYSSTINSGNSNSQYSLTIDGGNSSGN